MKGIFAASRSLLPVVALTVVAALCTALPARATSSANAGRISTTASVGPAAPGVPCNFTLDLKTCKSTNPTAAYTTHAHGDTSNCDFIFDVSWGDGGSITKSVNDPTEGNHLLADHTYAKPKTYTITVTVSVTAGNCTGTNSVHTFTLQLVRNIVLVPAGKAHVKGHAINAYRVTGKTHYRGKVAVAVLTRACGLAIGKAFITHEVAGLLFAPLGPEAEVVVLILIAPADSWEVFTHCVPIQVKHHKK